MARSARRTVVGEYARNRLRQECRFRGKAKEIHERTGLSQAHISNVIAEPPTRNVGDDFADAMAKYWGITRTELERLANEFATTNPHLFDDALDEPPPVGVEPPHISDVTADPYEGRRRLRELPEFKRAPVEVQRAIVRWSFSGGDKRSLGWWLYDLQERLAAHASGGDGSEGTEAFDPYAPRDEKTARRRDR